MPGTFNFDARTSGATNRPIYVGDSRTLVLSLTQDPPVDYSTGHTFLAEIAPDRAHDTSEVATFTVTPTAPDVLTLELTPAESMKLGPLVNPARGSGAAQWDLQVTNTGTGRVFTLLSGKVKIEGDVSRA